MRIYVASRLAGFGARMPRIEADAARVQRWRATLAGARASERWWVEALEALAVHGHAEAVLWTLADYPLGESFYRAAGFAPTGLVRREGTQIQYGMVLSSRHRTV